MAAPTFFDKGTLDAENGGTSITPIAFPASIAANDIAVMAVGCNGSSTFTTPTGQGSWAVLGTSLESDAGQSTEWYWLRLTGSEASETVTASATFSNTVGGYGQIWVFRGCTTSGNPFEGVGNAGTVSETTPDSSACTTTGADRLVVSIALLDNDTAFASGFPPSGWTDAGGASYSFSTVGGDWATYCMHRTEASATTVASAVVGTLGASTRWRTITFALIPDTAVTGTAAVTQEDDTSTASGQLGYSGSSTATQEDQTSTASGTVSGPVTGTVAVTQEDQTSTATGQLGYSGTSAVTQADQTSTASGQLGYTGTSATTQADQTSTAAGQLGYTGTSAVTQDDQTSTASGTVSGVGEITGSAAVTQDDQTSTASGQLDSTGTTAASQADQTSTAAGTVINPVTGTAAVTQDDQSSAAAGQLGYSGSSAIVQADQTATASGTFAIAITGLVAALQSDQVAAATGFVGVIPVPSGHLLTTRSAPRSLIVPGGAGLITAAVHAVVAVSDSHVVEVLSG